MPRENIHWEVLLQAAARAEKKGAKKLAKIISENVDAALLGAIAHDAPYYYLGGGKPFEAVASGMHGLANQDTFTPLRAFSDANGREASNTAQQLGVAFLTGLISHAITDIWFHPWIFYYSGDYYHEDSLQRSLARGRHRLLEVYLDAWLSMKPNSIFPRRSALSITRALRGEPLDYLARTLGNTINRALFFPGKKFEEVALNEQTAWKDSFWHIAYAQRLFISTLFGSLLRVASTFFPRQLGEFETLSSFRRKRFASALAGNYTYKNPVTGDEISSSLEDLLEGAIEQCAGIFVRLDSEIGSRSPSQILAETKGLSLNYGVFGVAPEAATIFGTDDLPLPGMHLSA